MRLCSVEGCGQKHLVRGLCNTHRLRLKRYGSLELPVRNPADRFWPKVDRRGDDECWLWTAGTFGDGYPQFNSGKPVRAHRYAYELLVGPIPVGLTLDHLCRTPRCVNPAHLEPVTLAENVRRGNRDRATERAMERAAA